MDEGVEAEGPCHETEGDLLSVFPVGAGVGGIGVRPVLDESPEGLGVFFVSGGSVGADEGVDEGEAVRFPDEFNIIVGNCFVRLGLDTLRYSTISPPRNDIIIGDLRPMFLSPVMPNGRKSGLMIFVGEVFEFAV